jgi:hypothetical protein
VLKRNNRPLLANDPEGVMRQLMQTRYPVYAQANITVESHDLPHDAIVGEIVAELAECSLLADATSAKLPAIEEPSEFPSPLGDRT